MEMTPDGSESEYVCTAGQLKCGHSLFKSLGLVGIDENGKVKNASQEISTSGLEKGEYCEYDFTDLGYKQTNWWESANERVGGGWSYGWDVEGDRTFGITIDTAKDVEVTLAYLTNEGYKATTLKEGDTVEFDQANPYLEVDAVGKSPKFAFTVKSTLLMNEDKANEEDAHKIKELFSEKQIILGGEDSI